MYLKQELASLSRLLVYAGLPSVSVVIATFFLFTADGPTSVAPSLLPVEIAVAITVGLLPLVVLVSFILRTVTVNQRTAATLPYTALVQKH